jgi:hypothetical protein
MSREWCFPLLFCGPKDMSQRWPRVTHHCTFDWDKIETFRVDLIGGSWLVIRKAACRATGEGGESLCSDHRLSRPRRDAVASKSKCPLLRAHEMSGLRLREYRRRGCGKVEIPRFGRDFQARWESPKDFSTERLFHSLPPAIWLRFRQKGPSLSVVASHHMRPIMNTPALVQVF